MDGVKVVYSGLCPICGKDLDVYEISRGICRHKNLPLYWTPEDKRVDEFLEFFRKAIGEPRAIQKFWARRILRGESFAAVAPTGIGKTSFGTAMALFLAGWKKKSYIILPTTLLVNQVVGYLRKYAEALGIRLNINEEGDGIKVIYYHSDLKKNEREKFVQLLNERKFDILVTTSQFLPKSFSLLKGLTFDFIFVDDVDAILKASKNVDRILYLLGFYQVKGEWRGEAKGVLMVSTATAKKGQKVKLFRMLLNFDVGTSTHAARNIEDIYIKDKSVKTIKEILDKMGNGGLLYLPTTDEAERLYNVLKDKYKIGLVSAERKKDYELFEKGELGYLVGTAFYYGTLVRGLDLPERIRYAVFVGAPVFRVRIEDVDVLSPQMIKILALIFRDEEEIKELIHLLPVIDRPKYQKELEELKRRIKVLIERGEVKEKDVVVRKGEVIFPDIRTYIQGSGRTSRLFAGGITKGASFLLEDNEEVLNAFIERAKYYDLEFKSVKEVDFEKLINEINETREKFKKRTEFKDVIKPTLFVVESPTKARQISRFFGQPSIKVIQDEDVIVIAYEVPTPQHILLVTASLGHITDLVTNRGFHGVEVNEEFIPIYSSIKRCRNCGYQFTEDREVCPKCKSDDIDDSRKRIRALRRLARDSGLIIIGTDPDAEGEKIAWDLTNLLSGCGEIYRAEFHEVTRRAVSEALSNLRKIDENLVRAQMVRRIEDRWIGFVLSQKLWKVFNDTNLSAGRAQTPVLGWIIERADKYRERIQVGIIKELDLVLEGLTKPKVKLKIEKIEDKEEERTPLPPYTTDALLRDANAILKLSAKEAMEVAQSLFENGLITYHRTDSTRVSDVGLKVAKDYLGEDFQGRTWGEGGAHECIRPTRPVPKEMLMRLIQEGVIQAEEMDWRHFAMYDLIFRRFMASQCKPYEVKVKKYRIFYDGREVVEERVVDAKGKAVELYKWLVWKKPPLPEGEVEVKVDVRTMPKAYPYTQSEIIQNMKERGIGRPSTYATILDKLFMRKYVVERKGRVLPTYRGVQVFNYLNKQYRTYVSEERTRILEAKMDAIERGELDYKRALEELYQEIRSIE